MISAGLASMHLLIQQPPAIAANQTEVGIQNESELQSILVPTTAGSPNIAYGNLRVERQLELKQQTSSSTKNLTEWQQQQLSNSKESQEQRRQEIAQWKLHLQRHHAIATSLKALDVYLNDVGSEITEEMLRNHFAAYGKVIDVHMIINLSTKQHAGSGFIAVQPTGDPKQILDTEHIVHGHKINVTKCSSCSDLGNISVGNRNVVSDKSMVFTEQTCTSSANPIQQQQQKQPKHKSKKEEEKEQRRLNKEKEDLLLQNHHNIALSQNALDLFVNQGLCKINAKHLENYFASFGKVAHVLRHGTVAYIAIKPTGDPTQLLSMQHLVNGNKIHVTKCPSCRGTGNKSVMTKQNCVSQPMPSRPRLGNAKSISSDRTETRLLENTQQQKQKQQQAKHNEPRLDKNNLQNSRKYFQIFVQGVKSVVTEDILKTYFTRFGEVLVVDMCMDPSTNKHGGSGYITFRRTADIEKIVHMDHIICGIRIKVEECYLPDDEDNESEKVTEIRNQTPNTMEPLSREDQLENAKQTESCQTETSQQLQLPTSEKWWDLQIQETVFQSEKPLEMSVYGVSAASTAANLKSHFTPSDEVLDVDMSGKDSTSGPSEYASMSQTPVVDPDQIVIAEHIVCGDHMNVEEGCSSEVSDAYKERVNQEFELEPLLPDRQMKSNGGVASKAINGIAIPRPLQQEQQMQQQRESISIPNKPLEFRVSDLPSAVTVETLRNHFTQYGEVLDTRISANDSTNKEEVHGCITLRPKVDPNQILKGEHIVCGYHINVMESSTPVVSEEYKERTVQNCKSPPMLSEHDLENANSTAVDPAETLPQENEQLQPQTKHKQAGQEEVDRQKQSITNESLKYFQIYADRVKSAITEDILETHFSRFGDVLEVDMCMDPSRNKHAGCGYITFRRTADIEKIVLTEHIISGVRIKVEKCYSPDDVEKDSEKVNQNIVPEQCIASTEQTSPSFANPIQQQQQQQPKQNSEKQDKLDQRRLIKEREDLRLQNHHSVALSQNALDLFVSQGLCKINAKHLKDYFASFGEVVHVLRHSTFAYIAIKPTGDPTQLLNTQHVVNGNMITVMKCPSCDSIGNKSVGLTERPKKQHETEERQPPKDQLENLEQNAPCQTEPLPEQQLQSWNEQHDFKIQQTVCQSLKFLDLYVNGLSAAITTGSWKTYSTEFGEVLDIDMPEVYFKNAPVEHAYITLRPTVGHKTIFETEHIVCGVPVNVKEYDSSGDSEGSSASDAESNDAVVNTEQPRTSLQFHVHASKESLTVKALRTYFGQFGEVWNVFPTADPSVHKYLGSGLITLRPSCQLEDILQTNHIIAGAHIKVRIVEGGKWKNQGEPKSLPTSDVGPNTAVDCPDQQRTVVQLYVEGVTCTINVDTLSAYFVQFGEVLYVFRAPDPSTNSPYGTAFINLRPLYNMETVIEAEYIDSDLRLHARILVPESEEQSRETTSIYPSDVGPNNTVEQQRMTVQLYVEGVTSRITVGVLSAYFAQFGEVIYVFRTTDPFTCTPSGTAYITLRPSCNIEVILHTEHIVSGKKLHARILDAEGEETSGETMQLSSSVAESNDMGEYAERPWMAVLFVEDVNPSITVEALWTYFSQLGEVIYVFQNPNSTPPYGTAYITLVPSYDMDVILQSKHVVSGKRLYLTILYTEGDQKSGKIIPIPPSDASSKDAMEFAKQLGTAVQLYVNGVKPGITAEALWTYFAQFGKVKVVYLPMLLSTNGRDGTAYITLQPSCDMQVILQTKHIVEGIHIRLVQMVSEGKRTNCPKIIFSTMEPLKAAGCTDQARRELELYVDGVKSDVTADTLWTYFAQFGEVLNVALFIEPSKNRHCGCGYISLRPTCNVATILHTKHTIQDTCINVRRPIVGGKRPSEWVKGTLSKKTAERAEQPRTAVQLYVEGVRAGLTGEELWTYFTQFGEVLGVVIPVHPSKRCRLGYSLITLRPSFDTHILLHTTHIVSGVGVHVQKILEETKKTRAAPLPLATSDAGSKNTVEYAQQQQKPVQLYVDYMKPSITREALWTYFAQFGEVMDVSIPVHLSSARRFGCAFITLRPLCDLRVILKGVHIISGVKIHAKMLLDRGHDQLFPTKPVTTRCSGTGYHT